MIFLDVVHHVLVALGPYEASFKALEFATDIYEEHPEAKLEIVHVDTGTRAMALIEEAETVLDDYDNDYTTEVVDEDSLIGTNTSAGSTVSSLVEEREVDHVVMGQPDRSIVGQLVSGSATNEVLENTPTPVTLVGTEPDEPVPRLDE